MAIEYVCCFCLKAIDRTDEAAVSIALSNLWRPDAAQGLQAHSQCGSEAFPKRAMVEPECLID